MKINQLRSRIRALSIISAATLVVFAAGTLFLSNFASSATKDKTNDQFAWSSGKITTGIQDALNSYASVLYSGRAFILNSRVVEPSEWNGYFKNQDVFNQYPGISAISYANLVTPANKASFEAKMKANYGPTYKINPIGDRDAYAVASLSAASNGTKPNGFDIFSTPSRRAVYEKAQASGAPVASEKIVFSTGQTGVFVTLPVVRDGATDGFVLVSFLTNDFFKAVINPADANVFNMTITDVTDSKPQKLYSTVIGAGRNKILNRSDLIDFGGRSWRIDYQVAANYSQSGIAGALRYLILIAGFLFLSVIALCFYIFTRLTPPSSRIGNHKLIKTVTTTTTEE